MTFRRFDTPGPVTVRVRCKAGSVELEASDEPTTEVEVSGIDAAAEQLVSRTRIEHDLSGGNHRVLVDVPPDGSGGSGGFLSRVVNLATGGPEVRIVVRCPAGSDLDVTTSAATIDASGRFGAADITTAAGDARLDHVTGKLNVRTASGDITVAVTETSAKIETASGDVRGGSLRGPSSITTASGDVTVHLAEDHLTVRTASGDVEAHDLLAGGQIQTASGDQHIERAVAGKTRLETVSGDLRIGVAKGTGVRVDAQSVSGDLSSDIDLDGDPDEDPSDAAGPTIDLRARTVSGDVRIQRAPAYD